MQAKVLGIERAGFNSRFEERKKKQKRVLQVKIELRFCW